MPRGGIKKKNKKTSVAVQGRCRCHSLLLNRTETLATRAMADRESSVALCHGVALKKKTIGRRPRERCVSFARFGIDNALQDRKERKTKGDKERAESGSLCCFN